MENEKVAIEAIAEEGARAYSKTVWTETTPITADKLNKMENGIADASMDIAKCLPLTGGTLTGNLIVPGESRFNNGTYIDPWSGTTCAIKASGNVAVQGQMRLYNSSEAVFHEVCGAHDVGMYLNANNWGIYDYQNDRTVLRYNMDGNRVEIQGRRAATWEGSNPTHHMFRYGSGLGGANGYITFSY